MEQSKLLKVPLCDISKRNQPTIKMQQTPIKRISQRIASIQRRIKTEIETDHSSEEEVSETENVTPEKEIKTEIMYETESSTTSMHDEKSEYEKMIEMNREKSLAFLRSLNIDEVNKSLREGVENLKRKPKRLNVKRPAPSTPPPRRKSRRLENKDLNLSEAALVQKALEEVQREQETVTTPEELPKTMKFEEALKGMEIFSNFVKDFSTLNHEDTKRADKFPLEFESMKTNESQIAKVVPSRITAITIHPVCDKIIISAGSKHGHIGFWNMNSSSNPYVFYPHNQGITNLKFNPYDSNQIVSSSYDGRLRCGDMEKHVFDEVYSDDYRTSCSYFDILSKSTIIVAHRDGNVAVVDNRAASRKASVKKHSCHDYAVKSLCVHPLNKNYFISSEIKGPIKLWDLRKLQKEPVCDIKHHRKSVTSAFFSPVTGNSILSTCLDDSLCIFNSSTLNKDIPLKKLIKHNNFTGRWLSTFKATWVPNSDDTFVVGSMLYPRRIEVFKDNGSKLYNLMNEDLCSITSLHAFHPSLTVLAGGNSSGKVFVFTD